MTVWTHWCEWDMGFEGAVWETLEAAQRDLRIAFENMGEDFEDSVEAGLLGFDSTEVRV